MKKFNRKWLIGMGVLGLGSIAIVSGVFSYFLKQKNHPIIVHESTEIKYEDKTIEIDTPYESNLKEVKYPEFNVTFKSIEVNKTNPDQLFKSYIINLKKPVFVDWYKNNYAPNIDLEFDQFLVVPNDKSIIDDDWVNTRFSEFKTWKDAKVNDFNQKSNQRNQYQTLLNAIKQEINALNVFDTLDEHKIWIKNNYNQIQTKLNELSNQNIELMSNEQLFDHINQFENENVHLKMYKTNLDYVHDFDNEQYKLNDNQSYFRKEVVKNYQGHEELIETMRNSEPIEINNEIPDFEELKRNNQVNDYINNTLKPLVSTTFNLEQDSFNVYPFDYTLPNEMVIRFIWVQPNKNIHDYVAIQFNYTNKTFANAYSDSVSDFGDKWVEFENEIVPNPKDPKSENYTTPENFNGIEELTNRSSKKISDNYDIVKPLFEMGDGLGRGDLKLRMLRDYSQVLNKNQNTKVDKILYKPHNVNNFNENNYFLIDILPSKITSRWKWEKQSKAVLKIGYIYKNNNLSYKVLDENNNIKLVPSLRIMYDFLGTYGSTIVETTGIEDSYENYLDLVNKQSNETYLSKWLKFLVNDLIVEKNENEYENEYQTRNIYLNNESKTLNPTNYGSVVTQYEMFFKKWFDLEQLMIRYHSSFNKVFENNQIVDNDEITTKLEELGTKFELLITKLKEPIFNKRNDVINNLKNIFDQNKLLFEILVNKLNSKETKVNKINEVIGLFTHYES